MNYMKHVKPNGKFGKFGKYTPVNPVKYVGDDKTIIYRSSLEYKFCVECDTNPSIIRWVSEPTSPRITYKHPFKKREATYYPDFYVQFKSRSGQLVQAIIELKAHSMANIPDDGDISKMSMFEKRNFIINRIKATAAETICAQNNMHYFIITDHHQFFKK